MKILIPQTPWELEFKKEDQEKTLSIRKEGQDWIAQWEDEGKEELRAVQWLELFKAMDKWVAKNEEQGWSAVSAEGWKVPLFVTQGSSDKEYHATLVPEVEGWSCRCWYGRRGSALKVTEKKVEVDFAVAWKAFREVVHEKVKEGYQLYIEGVEYQAGTNADQIEGVKVQLLTESSEIERLIEDDEYMMQEKFDGERRPIWRQKEGMVIGMNKNAFQVPLNRVLERAVQDLEVESVILDGEDLGGQYAAFDLLEVNGEDLRELAAIERKQRLDELLLRGKDAAWVPVRVAMNRQEKLEMIKELKSRRAEGVVFKKKDSQYKAGKNLEGDQIKIKFYEECSVRVAGVNEKRSVSVEVKEGDQWVGIGNVTIGGAIEMPKRGSVIEVRYLYAYPGGSLYQPSYKSPRNDVSEDQCVKSQLKYKADYDYSQEQWERIEVQIQRMQNGGSKMKKGLK